MPIFRCLPFLSVLLTLPALAGASPVPHGTVELISEARSIQPGRPFAVGLSFHLEPGWHIYWKNPGDSGLPPRVRWDLPAGIKAGEIDWPVPKRLPVGPLLDYGYEGSVLLPITLNAEPDLAAGKAAELKADLKVLVCRESCIPGKASLAISLPVRNTAPDKIADNAIQFAKARASMPKAAPPGWKISGEEQGSKILLTVQGPEIQSEASFQFFPANPGQIENAAQQQKKPVTGGIQLALQKSEVTTRAPGSLEGLLIVPSKDGETGYLISARVASGAPTPASNPAPANRGASQSLALIVLFAFLGGLVLNLMPCVFPVLSIKALHVLESAGKDHKAIRASAFAYTAGVLASFWVLVAALLILRAGGRSLGWGFQLQSPAFVAFLCCLLFVLGLSMAGMFELGQSFMSVGSGLAQRSGNSGSFFTGVLATVVATPCTAPFMGAAVGFALSQPALVCTVVFTAMAFGLASPFLILALAPQLGRYLPRPGRWMETLKQLMAFPIFATIIWLVWVFGQQTDVNGVTRLLISLLFISLGGWILGRWSTNRLVSGLALVLVAAAVFFSVSTVTPGVAAAQNTASSARGLNWEPFTPAKLESYRSGGKPVLIDFTAAWCLTCQVNDRVVFQSDEVKKRLKNTNIALLRADWTSYDPAITETLAKYGRSAVPLYVLYGANQTQPVILPDGVLRPSTLLSAMQDLKL
jgi:thiol:disulfide interchange protein DsbD